VAVGARAEPRTTRDVDIAVEVMDVKDAEVLVFALQSRGYEVVTVLQHAKTGRLATVRLRSPTKTPREVLVDLLFASSGIEPEIVAGAEDLMLGEGTRVPVASIGHLLAMKMLARDDRHRPQDWDDLRSLLREAGALDLEQAREGLRLVQERGYQRGKPLLEQFEQLLQEERE
jgi:predicted nucleotidyltransferase